MSDPEPHSETMSAGSALDQCQRRRIQLRVDGDRLIASPAGHVPPELQAALRTHRDVIIAALRIAGPGGRITFVTLQAARELVRRRAAQEPER